MMTAVVWMTAAMLKWWRGVVPVRRVRMPFAICEGSCGVAADGDGTVPLLL